MSVYIGCYFSRASGLAGPACPLYVPRRGGGGFGAEGPFCTELLLQVGVSLGPPRLESVYGHYKKIEYMFRSGSFRAWINSESAEAWSSAGLNCIGLMHRAQ